MHAVASALARRTVAAAVASSSSSSSPSLAQSALRPSSSFFSPRLFSTSATMSAANGHGPIPKIPIPDDYNKVLYTPLAEADPEVYKIIQDETWRQFSGLELIASENLTSLATMEANGSILTNKYSEGLPNARYYGGNEHIDKLEILTQQRALKAFNLDPKIWGVNVQPYAGSTANFAVFTAFLQPFERIMGLKLSDGGHLTHGAYTPKKNISASSIYFQAFPYKVDPKTGYLDYDKLAENADLYRPKLIISGGSAYPRDWDYKRLSEIAKANGALLMCDMAHISGLVAASVNANPFEYCDVVTTTTHKTLRGPRAGLIFFRKDKDPEAEAKVNAAVFPACQGGPHNNTIAGIAVTLKQAADPAFRQYALQIQANAREIAKVLVGHEYKIQTDGTDNHIVLWDLRPLGLTGSKIEKLADRVHITLNKNAVAGDVSAVTPGGVRIGTNALTSRSMKEPEMVQVAEFLHRLVQIALLIQKACGSKKLVDFEREADKEGGEGNGLLKQLHADVEKFATSWPLPGVPDTSVIQRAE